MKRIGLVMVFALLGLVSWACVGYGAKSEKVAIKFYGLDEAAITFEEKLKNILDMSKYAKPQNTFKLPVAIELEPNYREIEEKKAQAKKIEYVPKKTYLFKIDANDTKKTMIFGELLVYRVTKFAEHSMIEIELSSEHISQVNAGHVLVLRFQDPSVSGGYARETTEPEVLDAASAMGRPIETEVCRMILGNRPHEKRR